VTCLAPVPSTFISQTCQGKSLVFLPAKRTRAPSKEIRRSAAAKKSGVKICCRPFEAFSSSWLPLGNRRERVPGSSICVWTIIRSGRLGVWVPLAGRGSGLCRFCGQIVLLRPTFASHLLLQQGTLSIGTIPWPKSGWWRGSGEGTDSLTKCTFLTDLRLGRLPCHSIHPSLRIDGNFPCASRKPSATRREFSRYRRTPCMSMTFGRKHHDFCQYLKCN